MVRSESAKSKDKDDCPAEGKSRSSSEREAKQGLQGKTFMRKKVAERNSNLICPPKVAANGKDKSNGKNRSDSELSATSTEVGEHGFLSWSSFRKKANTETTENGDLALYDNEPAHNFIAPYISGYTTPGPMEREASKHKKAKLGVMLGVYLPTIQHILGVTMFIRLAWIVGVAGVSHTFLMLFICCLCTFLTCISVSAVATNGVVEGGGAYFMISRNLGPEFGSAVGILFYLANTVATSMYLVGGIEILLLYLCPGMTIGGKNAHTDTGFLGMMSNNMRLYATFLLIVQFTIVAMGVRFVQLLAPVSLVCVILSVLACYAGAVEKTISGSGQQVCMIGDHLLQTDAVLKGVFKNQSIPEGVSVCDYCNSTYLLDLVIKFSAKDNNSHLLNASCVNGFPGFATDTFWGNFNPNYPDFHEYAVGKKADVSKEVFQDVKTSFFLIMAIYFPAVTGILTGTNMSGDLANPQKSIPGGTIAAQITTSFIYFSLAFVFGATIKPELIRDKTGLSLDGRMVVALLAWPTEWVVLVGSFLSTFGAALQCLCSAPRLLQSIAKDDVIPFLQPFAKVTKKNEPFFGLLLTTLIAELGILMGAMDTIAAVLDFFFLMCYAFVNIICALHSILGAPNWRPRFVYYHWSLSVLGAALCFFIMFSTHWHYAILSIVFCIVIYKYVEWKGAKKEWGDGIRGLALSTAQYSLMQIPEKDPHPKNWRPQLLILQSMPWSKELVDLRYLNLLNFASQLKAGKGLTMVVSFLRGNPSNENDMKSAHRVKKRMENDMNELGLRGFAKTLLYDEDQITGSVNTLIQSIGIGGLRPNTLLLSWPTKEVGKDEAADSEYRTFTDKLLAGAVNGMALLVAKGITEFPSNVKLSGYLDVYWIVRDGGLCVLITFLLKQSKVWRSCKTRIVAVARPQENSAKLKKQLQNYVYQLRIDAEILVTELNDPELSTTAYERTLLMEERTKMLKQMQRRGMPSLQSTQLNDEANIGPNTQSQEEETPEEQTKASTDEDASEEQTETKGRKEGQGTTEGVQVAETMKESAQAETCVDTERRQRILKALDRRKVHKMHGAIRLNELILEHSRCSQLVLFSLPKPPFFEDEVDDYIQYLEVISDNLQKVLFVRGTGAEVITTSS
ncbi:hypothetical protein niasHS_002494 [Heterodera schachtii]|uniref:Uncharacterized protein n=1 Tax=Heterodera schachtii TaxID=97005 RepID=A0ABD2KK43_HETSC